MKKGSWLKYLFFVTFFSSNVDASSINLLFDEVMSPVDCMKRVGNKAKIDTFRDEVFFGKVSVAEVCTQRVQGKSLSGEILNHHIFPLLPSGEAVELDIYTNKKKFATVFVSTEGVVDIDVSLQALQKLDQWLDTREHVRDTLTFSIKEESSVAVDWHTHTILAKSKPFFVKDFMNHKHIDSFEILESETVASYDSLSDILDSTREFSGVYISSEWKTRTEQSSNKATVNLYWELLKNGWYESKKQHKKSLNSISQQQTQLLIALHKQRKDSFFNYMDGLKNLTKKYAYKNEHAYLSALTEKKKYQLDQGFITTNTYERFDFLVTSTEKKVELYESLVSVGVLERDRKLLNDIENIELVSLSEMYSMAERRSLKVKMYQNKLRATEFYPGYWDEVSVKLFAGQQEVPGRSDLDTVVGFKIDMPLGFNSSKNRIIEYQKSHYQSNMTLLLLSVREKISSLYQQFQTRVIDIKTLMREEELQQQERKNLLALVHADVLRLGARYEEDVEYINLEILDIHRKILEKRVDAYEILFDMSWLSYAQVNDILLHDKNEPLDIDS